MNYARLIFEDTPAFVPVPREMQHRKTEIIFCRWMMSCRQNL